MVRIYNQAHDLNPSTEARQKTVFRCTQRGQDAFRPLQSPTYATAPPRRVIVAICQNDTSRAYRGRSAGPLIILAQETRKGGVRKRGKIKFASGCEVISKLSSPCNQKGRFNYTKMRRDTKASRAPDRDILILSGICKRTRSRERRENNFESLLELVVSSLFLENTIQLLTRV